MTTNETVLVIDDSEVEALLLCRILTKQNCTPVHYTSGLNIQEKIEQHKPTLILLDIEMPDRSGLDVLKDIRSKFDSLKLPVLIISGRSGSANVTDCLEAGANDYIAKPFDQQVAIARIQIQLKLASLLIKDSQLQQRDLLHAMIITLNHEINNPLMIAMGCLGQLKNSEVYSELLVGKIEVAINRIAELTKKISQLENKSGVEYEIYSASTKMIKLG